MKALMYILKNPTYLHLSGLGLRSVLPSLSNPSGLRLIGCFGAPENKPSIMHPECTVPEFAVFSPVNAAHCSADTNACANVQSSFMMFYAAKNKGLRLFSSRLRHAGSNPATSTNFLPALAGLEN
ncbi:MAG: hypothetical protein AB3N14_13575 [Flavobacteriaceae bacterium]